MSAVTRDRAAALHRILSCARIDIEVPTMKHRASACRFCAAYKQVSGVRAGQCLLVGEAGILPLTTQELNSRAVG